MIRSPVFTKAFAKPAAKGVSYPENLPMTSSVELRKTLIPNPFNKTSSTGRQNSTPATGLWVWGWPRARPCWCEGAGDGDRLLPGCLLFAGA